MTNRLEIPLRFIDPLDEDPALALDPPSLGYVLKPTAAKTGKLRDRLLLRPQLDLGRYTVTAVVDWIRIGFRTGRRTQWMPIQRQLEPHLGSIPLVTGPAGEKRYSGDEFLVTIQDPEPRRVLAALSTLKDGFGVGGSGYSGFRVDGIEVAVDWRPKRGHDRERWVMVEVLRRHHLVHDAAYQERKDRPRSFISDGRDPEYALKDPTWRMRRPEKIGGVELNLRPECRRDLHVASHVQLPVDRTYYVGAKSGLVMFRIMDKTSDAKRPDERTRIELEPQDRRARIEARLDQCVPEVLGLRTADGLFAFRFEALRKMLFDFWLPTVGAVNEGVLDRAGISPPHPDELEVFRRTGVFGLERYHRAQQERHVEMLRVGLCEGRAPKLGAKSYRKAFAEINDRVEKALTHLTRRWSSF